MEPACGDMRERRGFFRINDDVVLTYHSLNREAYEKLENKASNNAVNSFNLKARFAALDQSLRPVMSRLRQHSEDLARCISAMDEKLEMLAEVLFHRDNDVESLPSQEVSLSAGGLSFHVQKALEPESILQVRMLLMPSGIGIEAYARVVYCRRVKEYEVGRFPYKVGVEFQHLREEDSDLIIRHVLCKEANERRRSQHEAVEQSGR
jgi:hypothetical protein